jgi:hypothetical protein
MENNIESLILKDDDELFLLVGKELFADEAGALQLNPKQLIERAKVWFRQLVFEIKPKLCGNSAIKAIHDKSDSVALIGAIVDVVAKQYDFPAPATIATLVARIGLNKLCKSEWDSKISNDAKES